MTASRLYLPGADDTEGEVAASKVKGGDVLSTMSVKNTIRFFSEAYSWTALLRHTQYAEPLVALCFQPDSDPSSSPEQPGVVESECKVEIYGLCFSEAN